MAQQTERDLLEAVRKSLTEYGVMGHFKAEMRASVMNILNKNTERQVPPDMPEETKLLNELIREYLAWNGYMYSEQVLGVESGDNDTTMRREQLASKLGVLDDRKTQKIPLLYYILSSFQNDKQ
ncbi:centrosomal protein 20 [Atheta coriaria]|uniref:centrosomal protein 20 n=1 Tax=Dalotia coriaria TaxID=877792 RepID=UPI0031F3D439